MSAVLVGFGCMRLSTADDLDDRRAIAVLHTALSAGADLLDTADVYCLDDSEIGHNERLIACALASWSGDANRVLVATKGGLRLPNGHWVPDATAGHLRKACEASLVALGVDRLDLYQLRTPPTPVRHSGSGSGHWRRSAKKDWSPPLGSAT